MSRILASAAATGSWSLLRPRDQSQRAVAATALAIAAAWAAIVALELSGSHHVGPAQGDGGHAHDGLAAAVLWGMPAWALMSVAMMLPGAIPAVRHVALNSLRWRRGRAVALFVAGYLTPWMLAGVVALAGLTALRLAGARPEALLAGGLALAALWQATPYKRRALRSCYATVPLPPRGVGAIAGCVRFGLVAGRACVGSCGLLMLAAAAAGGEHLAWMAALTALVTAERLLLPGRRRLRAVSLGLAVCALAVAL